MEQIKHGACIALDSYWNHTTQKPNRSPSIANFISVQRIFLRRCLIRVLFFPYFECLFRVVVFMLLLLVPTCSFRCRFVASQTFFVDEKVNPKKSKNIEKKMSRNACGFQNGFSMLQRSNIVTKILSQAFSSHLMHRKQEKGSNIKLRSTPGATHRYTNVISSVLTILLALFSTGFRAVRFSFSIGDHNIVTVRVFQRNMVRKSAHSWAIIPVKFVFLPNFLFAMVFRVLAKSHAGSNSLKL